jgi:hypothetical protein
VTRAELAAASSCGADVGVTLVPLEALCVVRCTEPEHVRALVRAGRLPPPAGGLVPPGYLPPEPVPPRGEPAVWQAHVERELRRFRDGQRRALAAFVPGRERQREQQLMRMGSAAWGAGLSLLMQGRPGEAARWLDRAAALYRHSLVDAEPGSWGRSIGALKARLLAVDRPGVLREARWTLELGALEAESATALYAGVLSLLALGEPAEEASAALARRPGFPAATAAAGAALARGEAGRYRTAVRQVLRSFEERDRYLENVPVADTVLTLQALAAPRDIVVPLASPLLPPEP